MALYTVGQSIVKNGLTGIITEVRTNAVDTIYVVKVVAETVQNWNEKAVTPASVSK